MRPLFAGDVSGTMLEDDGLDRPLGEGAEVQPITGTLTATDFLGGTLEDTNEAGIDNLGTDKGFRITSDAQYAQAQGGVATIDADGNWAYTPNANFNGPDSFTVLVTDDLGNIESQVINVTVEAVADLSAADDAASVDEDGVLEASVADNDSTISGGALTYALTAGATTANGELLFNEDGSYTYTPNTDYYGSDSFSYVVTDAASGESSTQTVTITVNPVVEANAISIDRIEGDSGVADDFQTNDTTLTVSGSLEKVIASDERVEISTDGGATWTTATVDGTNWSFEDPTAQDASFTYEARIAGPGDSVGATAEQAVTIDTVVNVAPPVVAVSQDEGVESPDTADDFVTNVVSPTVSGSATLALDETLQIQVDGGAWVDVVVDAETGAWNYQAVTTETNPDTGEENDVPVVYANGDAVIFTTRVVDDAGNVSEPVARTITIDTSADTDANAFTVTVDEGFEVTNATESEGVRVTLAGIDADAASVAVTFSDETENTVTADVTQDENGVWTVTATDLSGLADGPITVSAVVTDISGNTADAVVDTLVLDTSVSEAGGSGTTTVTIDGVTQDTGATPDTENDFVTNVVSPTVSGSATLALDETLQIQVNGGDWVDVTLDDEGAWTYKDGSAYADTDEVVYTTRIVDAAGNVGTTTVTQTVTIDTSVSEAGGSGTTTVTIDGVTQDTGATPDTENDFVTNVVSPTVSGSATLALDETLQIQVNGGDWVDVTVDDEGAWTYKDGSAYADTDEVVYTTRIVDAAGNVGTTTVTQTVTIDTSVSEAGGSGTTTVTIDGVTQDTGATPDTENDFVTNVVSPTVSGSATLALDETLQIQVNGGDWVDVTCR